MNKIALPLPAANSNEGLETISRNKLAILFDPQLFEVRDELYRDKGVDLTVEIKQGGYHTNFRFVVQLKSIGVPNPNRDGSISFSIEVSNVHYLMNCGMPAYYILYEHKTSLFYLEPAQTIYKSLLLKYRNRKFPKKFTVRFSRELTPDLIKEVYNSTLETGTLLSKLKYYLPSELQDTQKVSGILIDERNEVYSVEQNISFINQHGFFLLNQKRYQQLVEIEQRTHPRINASPTFNMVCGVAYYQLGNVIKAIELLKLAQKGSMIFPPDIQAMLTYTFLDAKYLLGIISKEDFQEEISKLRNSDKIGSFLKIDKIFQDFHKSDERDPVKLKKLHKSISDIISDEKDNNDLLVLAYARILGTESEILLRDLTQNLMIICWRINNPVIKSVYEKWQSMEEQHSERLDILIRFALKCNNFLAVSNLSLDKIEWRFRTNVLRYILRNWDSVSFTIKKMLTEEEIIELLSDVSKLDALAKTYEMLGQKENLIGCYFLKYELLDFAGRNQEAELTAEKISEIIEDNEFNRLKSQLRAYKNGDTPQSKFMRSFKDRYVHFYRIAKNSGLESYLKTEITDERYEWMEKTSKWSVEIFFDLVFPKSYLF